MNTVAFYDTKPYDREYFERAPEANRLRRQFHEFRLTSETAASVEGAQAVCVFVNDRLDASCLKRLHQAGVRLVALPARSIIPAPDSCRLAGQLRADRRRWRL